MIAYERWLYRLAYRHHISLGLLWASLSCHFTISPIFQPNDDHTLILYGLYFDTLWDISGWFSAFWCFGIFWYMLGHFYLFFIHLIMYLYLLVHFNTFQGVSGCFCIFLYVLVRLIHFCTFQYVSGYFWMFCYILGCFHKFWEVLVHFWTFLCISICFGMFPSISEHFNTFQDV